MQRKIHNQTLFVAALSVYLGLVLVGAPPHTLAQQILLENHQNQPDSVDKNKDNLIVSEESITPLTGLVWQLNEIFAEVDLYQTPISYSYSANSFNNQIVNFQVLVAEGDQEIIRFLQNKTAVDPLQNFPSETLTVSRILFDLKVSQTEFVHKLAYTFETSAEAKSYSQNIQALIIKAASKEEKKIQPNSFFSKISVSCENNQVFIVTRLPRAGLDAFLKANEKAN